MLFISLTISYVLFRFYIFVTFPFCDKKMGEK